MNDTKYLEMLEIPVQSCDVIIKPKKHKKKDIKSKVINMVNNDENQTLTQEKKQKPKRRLPKFSSFFISKNKEKNKEKKVKVKKVENVSSRSVSVKSSRFDIVSVQVVAIFVLIIGIILTNIFWENSGINTLLKSVFQENSSVNTATYSSFSAYSPSKNGDITLDEGVMTLPSGSVYAPCDGVVEKVSISSDGLFTITVRHSNSFTSVFSNLDYCYLDENSTVFMNIPIGYSKNQSNACLYSNDTLLTNYLIDGDYIVWQN